MDTYDAGFLCEIFAVLEMTFCPHLAVSFLAKSAKSKSFFMHFISPEFQSSFALFVSFYNVCVVSVLNRNIFRLINK